MILNQLIITGNKFRMNYTNLSFELYSIIKYQYFYNNHIWSNIHDANRYDKYGPAKSFDGIGFCGLISYSLKDYLIKNNVFDMIHLGITQKDPSEITKLGLPYADHIFLKVTNQDLIIDGTYKQLFINKRGQIDKLYSPYANMLYELPPVFIGTKTDLFNLMETIKNCKNTDPLHNRDPHIIDWHSEIKFNIE